MAESGGGVNLWRINADYASEAKFKKFYRRHSLEYAALFANLQRLLDILNTGKRLNAFQIGFFRSEGEGLFRIGQTKVAGAKESRLYVYPDEGRNVMFVLGIGAKESQARDLMEAKRILARIRAGG